MTQSSNYNLPVNLANYYKFQTEISKTSELFGQNSEHIDKIIMLFAEIYSFICDEFSIEIARKLIITYENSEVFKNWFWKIKHKLGEVLQKDPGSDEIGLWIGRGAFLKILYSILLYQTAEEIILLPEWQAILQRAAERQRKLLKELPTIPTSICTVIPGRAEYLLLTEPMTTDTQSCTFRDIMAIH